MEVGDPQWTERINESEGAQDPLAMIRVTDRLLRDLLPGITTISPRPRYISHHLWALNNVADDEQPESYAQLMRGLYQRERILLLSGVRHSQSDTNRTHTGIIGSSTASEMVEDEPETIDLKFSFSSNRSGSYGRNYRGPLQTMGLIENSEEDEFEGPAPRAEPIVGAYERLAQETELAELATADSIRLDQLDAIAEKLCPCAVSTAAAPDQEPLRALYLGRDPPERFTSQAKTRRESLTLMLHIARLGGDAIPLQPDSLVNACYYGAVLENGEAVDADLPSGLTETASRWKTLRAHDYFSYAIEAVLTSWLSYLKQTDEADATLEEFKRQARSEEVCERIGSRVEQSTLDGQTSLETVLSALWPDATSTALQDEGSVEPVSMTHPASEYTLDEALETALSNRDWTGVHATAPCLLLAISLRFASPSGTDAAAWNWMRSHTRDDLSPVRFREHLLMHLEADLTFAEFIDWLIDEYVITRATEIAAGKSSGVTATRGYFEQTAAGWRHVRDHTPGHWGARFDSAVSVLRDLALLEPDSSSNTLTPTGIELLEAEQGGMTDGS